MNKQKRLRLLQDTHRVWAMKQKEIDMKETGLEILNTHLFNQLDRLSDPGLKGDKLKEEIERSRAVSSIAKDIVGGGKLVLEAKKTAWEFEKKESDLPKMISGQ